MKTKKNVLVLGLVTLCGLAAAGMQTMMLRTGLDEKGLLMEGNVWGVGLCVLSAGVLLALILGSGKLEKGGDFGHNFPVCGIRFALSVLGGALMAIFSGVQLMEGAYLVGAGGVIAGVCMILAGVSRLEGKRPSPLLHILVCVSVILRLIVSFQGWSTDPQFQDYAVQMLALVCMMLFAYHRAACDAGLINRRRTVFFELAALYFCLASLSDGDMGLIFLAGSLWIAGAGVNLEKLPKAEEE